MIPFESLPYFIAMTAPFFSALFCVTLVVFSIKRDLEAPAGTRIVMALYFISMMVNWIAFTVYFYYPAHFAPMAPVFYLCVLLVPVFSYHLAYIFTCTGSSSGFPMYHYVLPVVLFAVLFIWWEFAPLDLKAHIGDGEYPLPEHYGFYAAYFNSLGFTRVVFSIVYTMFALVRVVRFHHIVAGSNSWEDFSWLRWLKIMVYLSVASTLIPMIAVMLTGTYEAGFYNSPIVFLVAAILIYQHILLTYNILSGNFVVIDEVTGGLKRGKGYAGNFGFYDAGRVKNKGKALFPKSMSMKKRFESYVFTEKPYTDPNLTIADLIRPLNTSRNTLSAFINKTYGMNFRRYVNRCRLGEYERLRADKSNHGIKNTELLGRAGFSNYKSYQRAKKYNMEDNS